MEKSAEVIVLYRNERMDKSEVSQAKEGPNVNWSSMQNGIRPRRIALCNEDR
tara:strand:- start:343 stop:498 length:156 start_codon:yes stop_codon:yes gene_type:complete